MLQPISCWIQVGIHNGRCINYYHIQLNNYVPKGSTLSSWADARNKAETPDIALLYFK